jgi:hypothetical protein
MAPKCHDMRPWASSQRGRSHRTLITVVHVDGLTPPGAIGIRWIYERGNERLLLEIQMGRRDNVYILGITWPDGRTQRESFATEPSFSRRLQQLDSKFRAESWVRLPEPA